MKKGVRRLDYGDRRKIQDMLDAPREARRHSPGGHGRPHLRLEGDQEEQDVARQGGEVEVQDRHLREGKHMEEKVHIVPGSVQETLIIPLYGRKFCSERFSSLYTDKSAARLCARLDYDFSDLDAHAKGTFWQFGALEAAMRQIDMEWEIRDYLASHPAAAVVNMGCGLDQTGRACDNGTCHIYYIDMADIIAAREQLVPAGERERNIAGDLNDHAWMNEVDGSNGAIFFAAGVFHYLTEVQARALVNALAIRFPGCRIVFDVMGKLGKRLMRKTFRTLAWRTTTSACT